MAEATRWKGHHGSIIDTTDVFEVIDCEECGFKHVVPLPAPEELDTVYRHEYYATEKPLYIERYEQDAEWWNLVYAERYELFEDQLPESRRCILDVGSGPGLFLAQGKLRGWSAVGVEPSSQSAAHSRALGLEIVEEFFDETTARDMGKFDVVHMSNVLEHVPDPRSIVDLAAELLSPGGLMCLVVPNDYSPFQLALRDACEFSPWWIVPPHHLNFFDFDSIQRLMESVGLDIIHRESTFPIDMFLLMGENYVGDDTRGRACHSMRMTFERNLQRAGRGELKRRLYECMADLGVGREVVIVGRK